MQPDLPAMDYTLLADHTCDECGSAHFLAALPAEQGWDVAVRCRCARNGHVRRYSTEATGYPTFDAAEVAIARLLHPPKVTAPEIRPERNVNWHKATQKWMVQVKRGGIQYTVGYYLDHAQAVRARDEFLGEELEAA